MKKTLASALTAALVVGAASTTFAAANPFSDVPSDHWAYDAVAQLAQDGVIEGYGDTTFQGDKNITRYEMAQMVAKAMAKTDVSAADKAMIDKLAAEFADELNNLGVRVSNLEKHADMVKWNGKVEYTYTSSRDKMNGRTYKTNDDNLLFRLEPTAEVNSNWDVHARIDAATKMDKDAADGTEDHLTLKRVWAQGNYKNFTTKFGKFGSDVNNTVVFDNPFSGFQVAFGNKLKATLEAGRVNDDELNGNSLFHGLKDTASYQGISLGYAAGKLSTKAAYQHFDWNNAKIYTNTSDDDVNIWSLAANYAFDKNVAFNAEYAKTANDINVIGSKDKQDRAYVFELNYKGADQENRGTWGAWAGYRYLGTNASLFGTQDAQIVGAKGWEVGANYTPFKNVVATAKYFNGKGIESDRDAETLWGRVEFLF